jgi:hypothetical protein
MNHRVGTARCAVRSSRRDDPTSEYAAPTALGSSPIGWERMPQAGEGFSFFGLGSTNMPRRRRWGRTPLPKSFCDGRCGLAAIKIKFVQKTRTPILKKTKEAILKEYHHKCAFGHANPPQPELHHIDGNPSNNDSLNLLPLCPNCHSYISKFDPRILLLFRKYKKNEILATEFKPLFNKVALISELSDDDYFSYCFALGKDLVAFVSTLKNGKYYAPKINKLIRAAPEPDPETPEEWKASLKQRRENIMELIAELLTFQNWKPKALPEN